MMFLLKAAFWLGLMLVLLPTGSKNQTADAPQIEVSQAATAASAAVSDFTQFCARQPESCAVGSQVASILAQRAQDGAIMVYDFIAERRGTPAEKNEIVPVRHSVATGRGGDRADTTGSVATVPAAPAVMLPRPRPQWQDARRENARRQDTLTANDREPAWRRPGLQQEARL